MTRDQILRAINDPNYVLPPGAQAGRLCAELAALGAIGGEYGIVAATPAKGVVLQIERLLIINSGAVDNYRVCLATAKDMAVVASTESNLVNFVALSGVDAPAGTKLSSKVSSYDTSGMAVADVIGNQFLARRVPAGLDSEIVFPAPGVILLGDDPSGAPSLAVELLAHDVFACFFAREWPLPPR